MKLAEAEGKVSQPPAKPAMAVGVTKFPPHVQFLASMSQLVQPFRLFWVKLQSHLLARIHKIYVERSSKNSMFLSTDSSSLALRSLLQSIVIHSSTALPFLVRYANFVLAAVQKVESQAIALSDKYLIAASGVLRRSFLCSVLPPLIIGCSVLPQPLPASLSHALFHSLYALILVHDRQLLTRLNTVDRLALIADAKHDADRIEKERIDREVNKERLAKEKEAREKEAKLRADAEKAVAEKEAA